MTTLKTVKYFKDLGLEFVEGDSCYDIENKEDFSFMKIIPDGSFFTGEMRVIYGDGDEGIVGGEPCNVIKFAWRENIGVRPGFVGEIEYELKDGCHGSCDISLVGFSVNAMNPVINWRPVLNNESEQKTIYTLKVNERCVMKHASMDSFEFTPKYIGVNNIVGINHARNEEVSYKLDGFEFSKVDTRTTEEKAVDDIVKSIEKPPTWRNKAEAVVEAIKAGKITGASFKGEE